MPVVDGVGYGESTPVKIAHLEKIIAMHLAITQAVLNKHPNYNSKYRYVDLTAGKGSTPDGTKGSPIVFLEQAHSDGIQVPYRADLIEHDSANLGELEKTVKVEVEKQGWDIRNIHFHCCDYGQKVHELFPSPSGAELGLFFVDHSGELPDFDTLHYLADIRPRMEILIYLSSTNVKRLRPYRQESLSDYMSKVGKQYWLFRNPMSWDKFKWTFLLGSNTDIFKDYRKIEFFRLDSETGQELFPKVDLSKKQYRDKVQPKLF